MSGLTDAFSTEEMRGLEPLGKMTAQSWQTVGTDAGAVLLPGVTYRLGFLYRTVSADSFGFVLSSAVDGGDAQRLTATLVSMPSTTGEWGVFWSAPFTVSKSQLERRPWLKIEASDAQAAQLEMREVTLYRLGD